MKYFLIYKIKNLINDKIYIGFAVVSKLVKKESFVR